MPRDDSWWGLPGPRGFLTAVTDDLRSGRNVVLTLPEPAPPGLTGALADRLRDDDLFSFRELELDGPSSATTRQPAWHLHERFAPLSDTLVAPSARTVALEPSLSGTVIWVSGMSAATWPAWSRFLEEYKNASRLRPEHDRCLLIVPLVGRPMTDAPRDDLTLAVHKWEDVVHRFDMYVYLHQRLERSEVPCSFRDLATAVAVEIAGTDRILADRLADTTLERIIEPTKLLTEVASERGWSVDPVDPPAWHHGMTDRRDGHPYPHSAAEIAAGRLGTVDRRVWRGQVAVLFPLLEGLRLRFVNQFRHLLTLPHRTEHGALHEAEALELAHLVFQLRRRVSAGRLTPLEGCKRMRDELAHLRPLRTDDLLDPCLRDLFDAG